MSKPKPPAAPISKAFCPKGSKGFFVLYYGAESGDFDAIRKLQPDFVITGALNSTQLKLFYGYLHDNSPSGPAVRAIHYVSFKSDDKPRSAGEIDKLVKQALDAHYEGIFFDDVDPTRDDFNYARALPVKKANAVVIMNPGAVVEDKTIFDYADIVSVENEWFKPLPQWEGIAPCRWLAVQGDPGPKHGVDEYEPPKELLKAMARLQEFRSGKHNGVQGGKGFWYYTSGSKHWFLPEFGLKEFKGAIAKLSGTENECP